MKLWWLVATLFATTNATNITGADTRKLIPLVFDPLPVGSIRPSGWLHGEMRGMADGLAGHEHDFYDFVRHSRWLAPGGSGNEGSDYSNLNEALPYWFNGLVPLAYSVDDERLKAQVNAVATRVLQLQSDDGWIGPEAPADRNFWARTPFLLGLTQLAEADDSWEDRVVKALMRFMVLANAMLKDDGFGFTRCSANVDCRWGQVRYADLILTIQWLLENEGSGLATTDVDILWENMQLLNEQSHYHWSDWYQEGVYQKVISDPTAGNPMFPYLHGVNVGQGLKASAVIRRFTKNDSLVEASMRAVQWTFKYHGAPSGTILADEIMRDLSPHMGSELCTAVETAYSLSYLYQALGDNYYADRSELAIFNALPAMLTADMWAHQYMAQPNQPWALKDKGGYFTTSNNGAATTFGLEPMYPCCTVNFPQGYPKFLTHSWARTSSGLIHMLLSPSTVTTTFSGKKISIDCETNYPFSNTLTYHVESETTFGLQLRIASWSNDSLILTQGDGPDRHSGGAPGTSITGTRTVPLKPGRTIVTLILSPLSPRSESRGNGSVSVHVGPLLYALDVGQAVTSTLPHAFGDPSGPGMDHIPFPQVRDYYLNHTTDWNVGIDPGTLRYHGIDGEHVAPMLKNGVFDYARTPTYVTAQGCDVNWGLFKGATPNDRPDSRVCVGGTRRTVRLIPYGAAKLHMSEIPTVDLGAGEERRGGLLVNAESVGMSGWAEEAGGTEGGMGGEPSTTGAEPPMQSVLSAVGRRI